ncbi:MAG: class I SAM-dependent methyltransferase [Terriglobales bacterium]
MSASHPAIRNVSDTARWTALYRARESERPDALFRDPYARQLAGERGAQIAAAVPFANKHAWSFTARTVLFDRLVMEEIAAGTDLVLNLAAGLDTRPYRLGLPPGLRWVEADLPAILDYKEEILGEARPRCQLERVRIDLAEAPARQALLARLGAEARRVTILSEGLVIYFSPEAVAALARDLAVPASFQRWILDLASPGLLQMMRKKMGREVEAAGAPFLFGPAEGPGYFVPLGWRPLAVHSPLKTAAQVHRLPWSMKLWALLPATHPGNRPRPWSGVCVLAKGN